MHEDRPGRPDDVALVREVAGGSYDALASLYDRHADAVFAAASRLTSDRGVAEEVVQDTFLALWDRAETFNPAAGSLSAWLHTIARNRTVDRLRAAGRRPQFVAPSTAGEGDDSETQLLERAASSGTIVAGSVAPDSPEAALASKETRASIARVARRDGDRGTNGDRPRLSRGPEPIGDRRAAGMAAGHGEDTDPAGASAPARRPRRASHRCRPGPAKTAKDEMDHDAVLEALELATAEPDGLERLMAGDTPAAQAVAGHLAGCAECTLELDRLRRLGAVVRDTVVTTPSPDLRDRTLAYVRQHGVPRGPAARGGDRPDRAADAGRRDAAVAVDRPWAAAGRSSAGSPPSPRPSCCRSSRPPLIIGARVDDRLAAQDAAIEDLAAVTTATLQVTAEPDVARVGLASPTGRRHERHARCSRPSTTELVVVADGLTRARVGHGVPLLGRCRRRPAGDRQDVLRRRPRLLGRSVSRGRRAGRSPRRSASRSCRPTAARSRRIRS